METPISWWTWTPTGNASIFSRSFQIALKKILLLVALDRQCQKIPRQHRNEILKLWSIDWFLGKKLQEIPYDSWENRWFPVKIFPSKVNPSIWLTDLQRMIPFDSMWFYQISEGHIPFMNRFMTSAPSCFGGHFSQELSNLSLVALRVSCQGFGMLKVESTG